MAIGTREPKLQDPIKKQRRRKTATDWALLIIALSDAVNGFIVERRSLFVPELRRTFLGEGAHAFVLVFQGKEGLEHAPFEADTFR